MTILLTSWIYWENGYLYYPTKYKQVVVNLD